MVLGAVEFLPEASGLQGDLPLHQEEMTDIIIASQILRIEIRLEMGLEMPVPLRIQLILIGIDRVRRLAVVQGAHDLKKGPRKQQIVVIQKAHIFPGGQLQGRIRIAGNSKILQKLSVPHPAVPPGVFLRDTLHPVRGAAVRDAQLQPSIALVQHRIHQLPQKGLRRLIGGNQDADKRREGKFRLPLPLRLLLSGKLG